mmetsp:Transcript_3380/g.6130  ORF Transcript_3380/g.6130 Transcript_3380/m.6130 type:complete len:629 (+) Transcript_3380:65-1951(+)
MSKSALPPPSMTPEENEQVTKFLAELEIMETEDPEQFAQVMAQLGLGAGGPAGGKGGIGTAKGVVDAISQMRASAAQGVQSNSQTKDIQLPDGQTMSTSGVQTRQKGIEITPEPGFVLKTKRLTDDVKVFINICKHDALAEPALKKKLDASGEEVEGMNIPLSVGPRRFDKDKSNVQCHVYDVIVNPTVIADVVEDITGKKRDFLCQLALQGIEQKYKEQLDKRYKLPKLRYLGDKIATQLIQDRKNQPVIEEINVPSSKTPKSKSKVPSAPKVVVKDEELSYEVCWLREGSTASDSEEVTITSLQRDGNGSIPLYIEPMVRPEEGVTHILFTALVDMAVSGSSLNNIHVKVSPFKLIVSVKGYKTVSLPLPTPVLPPSALQSSETGVQTYSVIRPVEGYTRLVQLRIGMAVDTADWSAGPDPGSKPWLIAEALGGGEARRVTKKVEIDENTDTNALPEDKFHINLPDDVDQYTGVPLERDDKDNEVFAEDKFHKADASSQYIIEQREKDIREKWEKHAKEKAEREADPNVEIVELDDYKVGGKYGPDKDPTSKAFDLSQNAQKEELQKASNVVASAANLRGFDWSQEPDINDIDCDVDTPMASTGTGSPQVNPINGLSSTLWTELLD